MRLSLRVGAAAALIIVTLILISRRVGTEQTPKSFWRFDTTSFRAALRQPAHDVRGRKWGAGTGDSAVLTFQTTPIEIPNEGIIVMGKLREEDTAWVSAELAE
jgi:hypothetical protein